MFNNKKGLILFLLIFLIICYVPLLYLLIVLNTLILSIPPENIDPISGMIFFGMIFYSAKILQIILLYFLYKWTFKFDNNLIKAIFNKIPVSIFILLACICFDYYMNVWGNSPEYLSTPFNIRFNEHFDSITYNCLLSLTSNFVVLYLISLFFKLKTFIKNKLHKNAD